MKHVVPENQPDRFYDNAIGILRIFAAASVMLLHYTGYALYVVRAGGRILEVVRHITELFPGVVIFFTISGYLCARSCEKYQAKEFLIRRGKRILPPIWLCTLVNTVFLMIVAGASLPSLAAWY